MKLRVRATHDTYGPHKPQATIGIENGALYVATDDDALADELRHMLAEQLFVVGHGFAKLRRDPVTDVLIRSPETGRTELERWVRLDNAHPDDVLAAVRDNLEISKHFVVTFLD